MSDQFTPARSLAIEAMLTQTVESTPLRMTSRLRRRWLPALGLVTLGLVTGGAISAAAVGQLPSPPKSTGIVAPAGVIPGAPIISALGSITTKPFSGSLTEALPEVPSGATHVRISVTCQKVGEITWGLVGTPPLSTTCGDTDVAASVSTSYDFGLPNTQPSISVSVSPSGPGIFTSQYLNFVQTEYGINDNGESFGTPRDGLPDPDLVAALGRTPQGAMVEGYVKSNDLDFSSESAVSIPLYEEDGVTKIGTVSSGYSG